MQVNSMAVWVNIWEAKSTLDLWRPHLERFIASAAQPSEDANLESTATIGDVQVVRAS